MSLQETHRCGTVAIIGRPNVGKSTLLNRFLGEKIAIVSPKPETTRDRLLGILTLRNAQILFLDTPGIYRGPRTLLAKHQVQAARQAIEEANVLLLMTAAQSGILEEDRQVIRLLSKSKGQSPSGTIPVFLAINKVDRVEKKRVLPQIEEVGRLFPFKEIFPLSATKGTNVDSLLETLCASLPEGPALYPPDQVTDRSTRSQVQELIREKTLLFTHEEIPHSIAVIIEEWRPGKKTGTYIRATLYVERESQKGILIGTQGGLLKRIGQAARPEIQELVEGSVFLDLWVKVAENWRKDPRRLREFGYGGNLPIYASSS